VVGSTRFYRVLSHQQDSGERFPVLIGADGIPPSLALRYAFRQRTRGSSARLATLLRDIATLYEWARQIAQVDLDEQLRNSRGLSPESLWHAAEWADLGMPRELAGVIRPRRGTDVQPYQPSSPGMYVRRMQAWHGFLRWSLYERNWSTSFSLQVDLEAAERRAAILREIDLVLKDLPSVPPPQERRGMDERELAAIEYGIGPDANGAWPAKGFAPTTRLRNYILYLLARHAGLRRSEMLVLNASDVPRYVRDQANGRRLYTSTSLRVPRRPDDELDKRTREASTKRWERSVPLAEEVLDFLWEYIESPLPHGRKGAGTPRLIVSETGLPLSIDRTDDIMGQIRVYASRAYRELFPKAFETPEWLREEDVVTPHSLDQMTWHRLRYTAAEEMLPHFVNVQGGLQQFLSIFGWADLRSARPYLRRLWREMAEQRMARIRRQRSRRAAQTDGGQ
jgi:hypothetical protein